MAIRKLEMHDRIASIYDDGSITVHPEDYTEERAQKETWDKNETNPAKQPKIAAIGYHVKEVLIDPVAIALAEEKRCPVCGKTDHDE